MNSSCRLEIFPHFLGIKLRDTAYIFHLHFFISKNLVFTLKHASTETYNRFGIDFLSR